MWLCGYPSQGHIPVDRGRCTNHWGSRKAFDRCTHEFSASTRRCRSNSRVCHQAWGAHSRRHIYTHTNLEDFGTPAGSHRYLPDTHPRPRNSCHRHLIEIPRDRRKLLLGQSGRSVRIRCCSPRRDSRPNRCTPRPGWVLRDTGTDNHRVYSGKCDCKGVYPLRTHQCPGNWMPHCGSPLGKCNWSWYYPHWLDRFPGSTFQLPFLWSMEILAPNRNADPLIVHNPWDTRIGSFPLANPGIRGHIECDSTGDSPDPYSYPMHSFVYLRAGGILQRRCNGMIQ